MHYAHVTKCGRGRWRGLFAASPFLFFSLELLYNFLTFLQQFKEFVQHIAVLFIFLNWLDFTHFVWIWTCLRTSVLLSHRDLQF